MWEVSFPEISDSWLTILRLGIGLQIFLFACSSWSDRELLYSGADNALINRNFAEAVLSIESPWTPRLSWIVTAGAQLGLTESVILTLVWLLLFGAAVCLLAGLFSRLCAIAAWFLYLCITKSGALTSYGMDNFTTIGLFYLMVAPLPDRLSFDSRIRKLPPKDPQLHGLHRRVLQIHLCLIYFFGGLTKAFGPGWWNGDSIWRALTRSPFNLISPQIVATFGIVLPLVGIFVCLLETSFPIFIWLKKTRLIWLSCIIAMHAGIALAMGLYLFGLIMIVLNLAAFGPELRRLTSDAPPFREPDAA